MLAGDLLPPQSARERLGGLAKSRIDRGECYFTLGHGRVCRTVGRRQQVERSRLSALGHLDLAQSRQNACVNHERVWQVGSIAVALANRDSLVRALQGQT